MKLITQVGLIVVSLGVALSGANAELDYHSERIKMMDVETLQNILSKNLKKLENKEEESPAPIIKQSLEILLAQPDQSLAASNYFSQFKSLAGGEAEFLAILEEIADQGISTLKNRSKDTNLLREQNTYIFILKNLVTEVKEYKENEFYRKIIEKIRDADINVSDSLVSYRLLNSMSDVQNPSKYAETVLPEKKPWWKFW